MRIRDAATTPYEKASACRSHSLRRCHISLSAKGSERGQNSNRKGLLGPTKCCSRESSPATRKTCLQRVQSEGGTTHMNGHAPWAIPLPSHLTVEESNCVCLEAHREGALPSWEGSHTNFEASWWPSRLRLVRYTYLHFLELCFLHPRLVLGPASAPYLQWSSRPPVASLVVARCTQSCPFSTTSPVCGGSLKHPLAHEHAVSRCCRDFEPAPFLRLPPTAPTPRVSWLWLLQPCWRARRWWCFRWSRSLGRTSLDSQSGPRAAGSPRIGKVHSHSHVVGAAC